MIKTRFAPSPTGFLHVGGLRTALFAYLFARKHKGIFALRVEDTDRQRLVEGGVENIVGSLKWAGIEIDEGVLLGENGKIIQKGAYGPYIQSERLDVYKKHAEILLEKGFAYYCFCSKERLEDLRKQQETNKEPGGYDGHCRNLSSEETNRLLKEQNTFVLRLKIPKNGETVFTDMIRGELRFKNELIDDQVILKADGYPTYHLANVVDDHLMGITHVVRGEEWLPSTPKHCVLYDFFGWEAPIFAHLSLLVNEQKAKLSKRHGDVSVEDFKGKGYVPEALVNFVAFLGWNPGDEKELLSLKELEEVFSMEKVSKAPAVFNREKLNWYNKQYMMSIDLGELTQRALPFFLNEGVIDEKQVKNQEYFNWLMRVIELERSRVNTLGELVQALGFVFADQLEYEADLLVWKKANRSDAKKTLTALHAKLSVFGTSDWLKEKLEKNILTWIEKEGIDLGNALWPLRVALSGQKNSPGPFEIAAVLGKMKTLQRLERAIEKL
ncbi:MAG: glutamate--tRNA ligase [Candidatus Magasanikbacteria bacterium]|nr:glutamate--tRNA ligase [Candidatus Magasanikbacteria bacterium]